MKIRSDNERTKRAYFVFLREAKGRDGQTVDAVAAAINRYEVYTEFSDFRKFHFEKARAFKRHLDECKNARTGKPLSAATIYSTLNALKAFFQWLADRPGYKAKLKYSDAEYFSAPDNLSRIATARREKTGPSLDQIKEVIAAMPGDTEVERRDRALIAFTIITGARDGAVITFKLKHVDLANRLVRQDARQVDTKRKKTFDTWFFPVGEELTQIVSDWVGELRQIGFVDEDPLFPKTEIGLGPDQKFAPAGLSKEHWANAMPMRSIFKAAFARAGHPYANPHSFRNTLIQLAYRLKLDPEQFKAWSQNLGHDDILTTFSSYGDIAAYRQAEIMRGLAEPKPNTAVSMTLEELVRFAEAVKKRNVG